MSDDQPYGVPPTDEHGEDHDAPNQEDQGEDRGRRGAQRGGAANLFGPQRNRGEAGQREDCGGRVAQRGAAANLFGPQRSRGEAGQHEDHGGRGVQRGAAGTMYGPQRNQGDAGQREDRGGRGAQRGAAGTMFGPLDSGGKRDTTVGNISGQPEGKRLRGQRAVATAKNKICPQDLLGPVGSDNEDLSQSASPAQRTSNGVVIPGTSLTDLSQPAASEDQIKTEGGTKDSGTTASAKVTDDHEHGDHTIHSACPSQAQETKEDAASTADDDKGLPEAGKQAGI